MSSEYLFIQLQEVIGRLIQCGLSVKQFHPVLKQERTGKSIGSIAGGSTSAPLRNIPYNAIYLDLERNDCYHVKFPDGALLLFQYSFDKDDSLVKHRLGFFPPSDLPTIEEAPHLYENDELYGDILLNRIVRFPIRFDFDPQNARDIIHPHSHLTFGQFDNCRIPVSHPITPYSFSLFILTNFYHRSYIKNKNLLDKRLKEGRFSGFNCSITNAERRLPHLVVG